MDKRGTEGQDIIGESVIFSTIVVIFLAGSMIFVGTNEDNSGFWEDFYAKEISLVLNYAEPGDEIFIDITKATKIAFGNGKEDIQNIFVFDNEDKRVTVSLKSGTGAEFRYFSNIEISEWNVERVSEDIDSDRLKIVLKPNV